MRRQPASPLQPTLLRWTPRDSAAILRDIGMLLRMHKQGLLGGAVMPEDSNPGYPSDSREAYHYFTLPMALNYQRNSYRLWDAAKSTAEDPDTRFVFDPRLATSCSEEHLRIALLKHRLALQPKKHIQTWRSLCETIVHLYDGDIRAMFRKANYSIKSIKAAIQISHKKRFPYLSGEKICNYWLYVISSYTDAPLSGRNDLSVAPDTHVLSATVQLGLVAPDIALSPNGRQAVSAAWATLLANTEIAPIDIHTPLWLWSRKGFPSLTSD